MNDASHLGMVFRVAGKSFSAEKEKEPSVRSDSWRASDTPTLPDVHTLLQKPASKAGVHTPSGFSESCAMFPLAVG